MSQTEHQTINITDCEKARNEDVVAPNWIQMARNHEPETIFTDGSAPLFTMYCEMTERENERVEAWLKNLQGVIIFMGLFSAAAAALLTVTVQDLKQDFQETSAFYLENIYKLQAEGSNASLPFTPAQPPQFTAPSHAIWVNALLFASLCLDIFAAILAMMIREEISERLRITESPRYSPQSRARLREIIVSEFKTGPGYVAIGLMLYVSGFFFFIGLSIYLFHISRAVFGAFVCFACLGLIAFMVVGSWLVDSESRSESSAGPDDLVLDRLFKAIVKDSDLVQYLASIPGFCRSLIVDNPLLKVTNLATEKLHKAVNGLLERTWSSKFLSGPEKLQRLVVCVNFADATRLSDVALSILREIFPQDQHNMLRSVEMGQSLRSQESNFTGQEIGLCAQIIVAGIIHDVQDNDDGWVALAADQLDKSEDIIRSYLEHGKENVLLANLIHITRQIFHSSQDNLDLAASSSLILTSISNFDVRNTLLEVQDSFRALWHEIEDAPSHTVSSETRDILLNLYTALTQGTVNASTAPPTSDVNLSKTPPDSISPVQETVNENTQTRATIPPAVSHYDPGFPTSSFHFLSPDPGQITADLANESSPGGIPKSMPRLTTAAESSDPTPLGSHSRSGTSQAVASTAATTTGYTESTKQPTVRHDSGSVPPAIVTPVPFIITPEVSSAFRPHVTSTPAIAHHDAPDPIEMRSLPGTRQSDPSAETRNLSDNDRDNSF